MLNWLKRLFGGSESSSAEVAEPVTAPEPATMPSEPDVDAATGDEESTQGPA